MYLEFKILKFDNFDLIFLMNYQILSVEESLKMIKFNLNKLE